MCRDNDNLHGRRGGGDEPEEKGVFVKYFGFTGNNMVKMYSVQVLLG